MKVNIFDSKKKNNNRKRNIIRSAKWNTKNNNIELSKKKDSSNKYKSILKYYKNENKTNKFIDKRKKNKWFHKNRKLEKKNIFNLNDDLLFKSRHISTNDFIHSDNSVNENDQENLNDNKIKRNKKYNAMLDKIEEKKIWKLKKYEIKEKLRKFDEHFDEIQKNVLGLNGTKCGATNGVVIENKKNKLNKFTHASREKHDLKIDASNKRGGTEKGKQNCYDYDEDEEEDYDDDEDVEEDYDDDEDNGDEDDGDEDDDDDDDDNDDDENDEQLDGENDEQLDGENDEQLDGEDDEQLDGENDEQLDDEEEESDDNQNIYSHDNQMLNHDKNEHKSNYIKTNNDSQDELTNYNSYHTDNSDNEEINKLFNKETLPSKKKVSNENISKEKLNELLEKYKIGDNINICNYFINNTEEEKENIPIYIYIKNKEYDIKDVILLLDDYNFETQEKILYRIYYINMFNTKATKSIYHFSFFFSLIDYFILSIYKCLKYNMKVCELLGCYEDIIVKYCHEMKAEFYLYISFLLLIVFSKIQRKVKTNIFFKNKKKVLQDYVILNEHNANKKIDVYIYRRILKGVDMFTTIFENYNNENIYISNIHFAILFLTLTVYPINNFIDDNNMSYVAENKILDNENDVIINNNYFLDINKNNISDEKLLYKMNYLKEDINNINNINNYNEQKHPIICYIIEILEFLFYNYFYTNNANLLHLKDYQKYDWVFHISTYENHDNIEVSLKNLEVHYSFSCFENLICDKNKESKDFDHNEINNQIVNDLGIFYKKKEFKNAMILLNLYNIIMENTLEYNPSFFYLSFKILNTLLYNHITSLKEDIIDKNIKPNAFEKEKQKSQNNNINNNTNNTNNNNNNMYDKFDLSFIIFKNIFFFLKIYIDNDINIYILINHVIIPSLFYLYMNFLKFIVTNNIKLDFINIINITKNINIKDGNDFSFEYEKTYELYEKYLIILLYIFKLIEYSQHQDIKPIIHKNTTQGNISFFTPKYANNQNPKDFIFMQNNQTKLAEMKSIKKKIKQQRKFDYNEMRKENNYILALKAKDERDRKRRNQEKYKKIKMMAQKDVEEYNKMKTYTH
ncbi:conserved membrane protein, unknown function [Plasmodium gaboni]|uniref:Uncharacterized protein n=1 Tax=Plasmodium gaboni TaxID=647221 RepID=A0A151LJC5_9APIC|nr:conserved membrane protein, unknown function [Plasmodium gaboni]KYN98967.1 conserved membrane protein, unknown function [Plasmodium gaboni]